MILSHIVALAKNNVIGLDGKIPWHLSEDLKYFKAKTKGHLMIVGRKTYESMGGALPHRFHIVVTHNKNYDPKSDKAIVATNLKEALEIAKTKLSEFGEEVFLIGGHQIFQESMDLVDTLYLTQIHMNFKGDTYYPKVDLSKFKLISEEKKSEPFAFSFLVYKRK